MVGFNLKNLGTFVRSQAFDSGKQHHEFLQVALPHADCMEHLANAFCHLQQRALIEQQELRRVQKEQQERERLRLENEKRREREEEDALEKAR